MKINLRVGWEQYEEIELTENQVKDLLDFVLNGERGYYPHGSIYLNNEAILANLKSGQPLNEEFYQRYIVDAHMQK